MFYQTPSRINVPQNAMWLNGWDAMLVTAFDQIEPYKKYVEHRAEFDTHQGVKGLELPRVMVIMAGLFISIRKAFRRKTEN